MSEINTVFGLLFTERSFARSLFVCLQVLLVPFLGEVGLSSVESLSYLVVLCNEYHFAFCCTVVVNKCCSF